MFSQTQACGLDNPIQAFHVKIKFIDLFAGIGGFHRAMSSFGHTKGECVLACEIDPHCRKVYAANFGAPKFFPVNIRELTRDDISDEKSEVELAEVKKRVPAHDVLCAGFPCQPFSKSGKQHGVKDRTRGTLFFDIMQIVRARAPKYIFLENVRNLAGPRHQKTLEVITQSIRDEGYAVLDEPIILSPHLLSVKQGGSPQIRERVFILAIKGGHNVPQLRKIADAVELIRGGRSDWDPNDWRIADILEPDSGIPNVSKYRVSKSEAAWLDAWDDFVKVIPCDDLPGFPIWAGEFPGFLKKAPNLSDPALPAWKADFLAKNYHFFCKNKDVIMQWWRRHGVENFPASRQKFEWQARRYHKTQKGRTIRDLVIQMRPSGIRVKPPTYLPALVAITQTSIIGPGVAKGGVREYRTLTPSEAALLQGMPRDCFSLPGGEVQDAIAYKQLGNAVNVGVIRFLAERLIG